MTNVEAVLEFAALAQTLSGASRVVVGTQVWEVVTFHGAHGVPEAELEPLRAALSSKVAGGIARPLLNPDPALPALGVIGLWGAKHLEGAEPIVRRLTTHLALEQRLREMRRQLERADRLAMVGRLAAGIAHELGTPLSVVAGRARQLSAGTIPPAETSAVAKGIAEQADRMAGIIRQLLDYARRRGPRPGKFDVRTLLRQAVALLEPVAQRRSVSLMLTDLPVARVVQFDGSQMMQVMTNLLANAIQATAASGQVVVSLEEAVLEPPEHTGLPTRLYVGLRVRDTGTGIKPEQLEQVFEPFFTTKDTGEGTGLGLSVSQGIVRDHEGWIAVESQLGQGSSFIVHLPG